jgi:sugar transferase (PEP-CTERM system associated)
LKVLSHHVSAQTVALAAADLLLSLVAVYVVRVFVGGDGPGTTWGSLVTAASFAAFVSIGMAAMGAYSSRQRYRIEGVLARAVVAVFIAVTGMAVLEFVFAFGESRVEWWLSFLLTLLLLCVARIVAYHRLDEEVFRRRVLVYGAGKRASSILQLRRSSDQRGFRVVAFLRASGDAHLIDDERVQSDHGQSLLEFVKANDIDEIVVAVDDRRKGFPIAELLACKFSGLHVVDLLEFLERETGRVKVDMMNPSWIIFSDSFHRSNWDRWAFRVLDLLVAICLLLVAWPFMIVIALIIALDDGRPIIYKQHRIGLNGREFRLYKFRSMRKDAEAGGAAIWAKVEDPRVTRVGNWLRKLRLDELPQLINVLRGDMSIVGPRPERPEFVGN